MECSILGHQSYNPQAQPSQRVCVSLPTKHLRLELSFAQRLTILSFLLPPREPRAETTMRMTQKEKGTVAICLYFRSNAPPKETILQFNTKIKPRQQEFPFPLTYSGKDSILTPSQNPKG